jgi:hypothetical protein
MKQVLFNTLIRYTLLAYQSTCSTDIPNLQQYLKKSKKSKTIALKALHKVQKRQAGNATPYFKEYQSENKVCLEGTPKLSPR